ncbi:MAG TPA: hypothetical protein VMF50_08275 [Candidatus Binataceae bacterium]|nr:hypothetical protein [Candidatus Binataceae bacterium]
MIERTWPVRSKNTARVLLVTSLIISAAAVLAACGVKSAPIPPEKARPERITSLTAASVQDGVMLRWDRPTTYAGGNKMRDLGGFVIMRAEGNTAEMEPLVEIPVTDLERFQVQMRFNYDDIETKIGSHYRYAIISETTDGYRSLPSNVVEITRMKPPPPPNPANFQIPTPSPLPT